MRQDPIFLALLGVVEEEVIPGKERQALSYHTTAQCRRGAPLESLKGCGLDVPITMGASTSVRLRMPNFMEAGDGRRVEFLSAGHASAVEAKRRTVMEYLTLLLGAEPNRVHLPPKCFRGGERSIERLRDAA